MKPVVAEIPDGVTPFEWLVGVLLCTVHGYSADEALEMVKLAAEQMRSDTDAVARRD